MKSVTELYRSAKASGLSILQRDQFKVRPFSATALEGSLLFEIPVYSFSRSITFDTKILFTPVTYITEDQYTRNHNTARVKINGVWYYYVTPTLYSTVQVSCTCENYKYTWAYYNAGVGSHYGELPHIDPPKGVRPPRNPQHLPGMCKHLYNAFNGLYGMANCELPSF